MMHLRLMIHDSIRVLANDYEGRIDLDRVFWAVIWWTSLYGCLMSFFKGLIQLDMAKVALSVLMYYTAIFSHTRIVMENRMDE